MKIANLNPEYNSQLAGGVTLGSPTSGDVSGGLPGALTVVGLDGIAFSGSPANTDLIQYNGSNWVFVTPASLGIGTGLYVEVNNGGKETVSTVAASGASQTLNLANGNLHDVTLTANCTLTFSGATAGKACSFTLWARQDGTGSRTVTWPGSVVWSGGSAPTLATAINALDELVFISIDGGTTWLGHHVGGGAALGTATPLVESGAGTAGTATSASHEDHVHPATAASGEIVLLISDSTADFLTNEAGTAFLSAG